MDWARTRVAGCRTRSSHFLTQLRNHNLYSSILSVTVVCVSKDQGRGTSAGQTSASGRRLRRDDRRDEDVVTGV